MADSALFTAAAGIHTAQTRLNVSAHNIVNATTRNYRKQDVIAESHIDGVESRIRETTTPGKPEFDPVSHRFFERSNVDIAEERVSQIEALAAAKANGNSVRTADEMLGTVVDLKR